MSEERDIDEALGFDWIEGKLEPIYEITPEIDQEGLTIAYLKPNGR